jgi:hypothetical protein
MANGLCDNLLLATYLSATCPGCVVPYPLKTKQQVAADIVDKAITLL